MINNEAYNKFCVDIKEKYGLNMTPQDEFFPLVYNLITANNTNTELIQKVVNTLEKGLSKIESTNQNLYSNQSFLLSKNEELIKKVPRSYAQFVSYDAAKGYWNGKIKYALVLSISALIFVAFIFIGIMALKESNKTHMFFMNANIESYDGKEYLLLDRVNSIKNIEVGKECIEWKNNQIAVPITN